MKVRRSVIVVALLLAVVALVVGVAACGSSSSSSSSSTAASTTPVKGGTMTVTFQGEPTGLDPAIAWEVESNCIQKLTYQTLLSYAPTTGEAGTKLVGDAATEVPTAANGGITQGGKVYTFHIKPDLKFAPFQAPPHVPSQPVAQARLQLVQHRPGAAGPILALVVQSF